MPRSWERSVPAQVGAAAGKAALAPSSAAAPCPRGWGRWQTQDDEFIARE